MVHKLGPAVPKGNGNSSLADRERNMLYWNDEVFSFAEVLRPILVIGGWLPGKYYFSDATVFLLHNTGTCLLTSRHAERQGSATRGPRDKCGPQGIFGGQEGPFKPAVHGARYMSVGYYTAK